MQNASIMSIFFRHWRINLAGLVLCLCFFALSYWQYGRAQEKARLFADFSARTTANPLTNKDLVQASNLLFYRANLHGTFDHAHTILLENRTYQGKIGYEVYTPLRLAGSPDAILVDRGFIPLSGRDRNSKPILRLPAVTTVTGLLNAPPRYYANTAMVNDTALTPLIRVQYIDLQALSQLLTYPLLPYVLQLAPSDPAAYPITWQSSIMPKEKHLAYALQWFALSLTLLVLFVALNMRRKP